MPAENPFQRLESPANEGIISYEAVLELPPQHDCARSVVVWLSYDEEQKKYLGGVSYEVEGNHNDLGYLKISPDTFQDITGHITMPEGILKTLSEVEGNVSIRNGIACLPDGTSIRLK